MAVSVVSLALAMALQARPGGAAEWKTVTSSRGGFSVAMPGEAQSQVQTQQGPKGPMVVSKLGDVTYIVLRIPNRDPVLKTHQEEFFDCVRSSFAEGAGRKLVSEKRTTFAGTPADDFTVETATPDGQTLVLRARFLLWDANTTFNLQVIAPRGQATDQDVEKFFASFKTVKVNPNAARELESAGGEAPKWGTFSSAGGGFSVRMPGKPAERTQTQKTPNGDFEIHTYLVERTNCPYTATYYIFPERIAALDDAGKQKSLDDMCKGAVTGMKGTMLELKPTTLGKIPGREFRFEFPIPGAPAPGLGRAVAYLDGRKAYRIMVRGEPSQIEKPEVDTFLKSFRLTGAEAPKTAPGPRAPAMPGRGRIDEERFAPTDPNFSHSPIR